jgi:large subunit ribosomal protein L5
MVDSTEKKTELATKPEKKSDKPKKKSSADTKKSALNKTESHAKDLKDKTVSVPKSKKSKTIDYYPYYKTLYKEKIINNMVKRFGYKSIMEVPKLSKITLNMGIGDAKNNPKALESGVSELTLIAGQKAVVTIARRDVSNFKIRRGFPVGCKVKLRANRMYEFFQRLNSIALPRTRDFTGLSFKSFDGRGNYNFGVIEQIIFTEIDYDKIDAIRGLDIAINTTAKTDDEAYWLLKEFGFPLREKPVKQQQNDAPIEAN